MTFQNFVTPKDKENGNRTFSRHPKLYRDKEGKEVLERMSRHKKKNDCRDKTEGRRLEVCCDSYTFSSEKSW